MIVWLKWLSSWLELVLSLMVVFVDVGFCLRMCRVVSCWFIGWSSLVCRCGLMLLVIWLDVLKVLILIVLFWLLGFILIWFLLVDVLMGFWEFWLVWKFVVFFKIRVCVCDMVLSWLFLLMRSWLWWVVRVWWVWFLMILRVLLLVMVSWFRIIWCVLVGIGFFWFWFDVLMRFMLFFWNCMLSRVVFLSNVVMLLVLWRVLLVSVGLVLRCRVRLIMLVWYWWGCDRMFLWWFCVLFLLLRLWFFVILEIWWWWWVDWRFGLM